MAIKPEDWLQGPNGMMSLGDMLEATGYTVDRDNWVPPPPPALIPVSYEESPLPPSPSGWSMALDGQWLWMLYMPQDPGPPFFWGGCLGHKRVRS
eukprot:6669791-Karenia_brevis.AAC.1